MNRDDLRDLLGQVDSQVEGLFAPPDPALQRTLRRSREVKLPEMNVSPNETRLLPLLAGIAGARHVLQISTLVRYSTVHVDHATSEDGALISLKLDEHHASVARENIRVVGH